MNITVESVRKGSKADFRSRVKYLIKIRLGYASQSIRHKLLVILRSLLDICYSPYRFILFVQRSEEIIRHIREDAKRREQAFFIERKLEHTKQLSESVFSHWLNAQIKFEEDCESISLTDVEIQIVGLGFYPTKYGEIPGGERKPEYYATAHLMTGYPETWRAFQIIYTRVEEYAKEAQKRIPHIKELAKEEMRKRCPNLAVIVPSDRIESCYSLDLLLQRFLEYAFQTRDLSFLLQEPRKFGKFYEYASGSLIILRTTDSKDIVRMRESIEALRTEASDDIMALTDIVRDAVRVLETFKIGLRDIVTGVKFGQIIKAKCDGCRYLGELE